MSGKATQVLSPESVSQLQQGIDLLLSRWYTLQIAVQEQWGGPDSLGKSQQLAADIFYWLTQSKEPLHVDDVEVMLDEFMDDEFDADFEDGSIKEIAEKLTSMHEECLGGNYQSIQKLKETKPLVVHIRQGGSGDDDDDGESVEEDESSEMAVDAPNSQSNLNCDEMRVDEPRSNEAAEADGWTVVSSRRNRGRKN